MSILYLDVFSGISGDMFLGSLIDLGVDARLLEQELGKLSLAGYHIHVSKQERGQIAGTKFDVHVEDSGSSTGACDHSHSDHAHSHSHASTAEHSHPHDHSHAHSHSHGDAHPAHSHDDHADGTDHDHGRTYTQIRDLIRRSSLSAWVKDKAQAVFHRVAVAEGKIHGKPPGQVHFHEVGAVDSIVDIVGACIGLEMLGYPRVLSGSLVEGVGFVQCAHGRFPLPAPATLEILAGRKVTIQQTDEPNELMTPTGAAILAEFAEEFGPMPRLRVLRVGYGLGGRENKTRPNVLRAVLGEADEASPQDWERDEVVVLESNLDDVSPEILGAFLERALAAGAWDVFHTPIQMKKNRPGVLLSVLCPVSEADRLTELMLRETSAFGVRRTLCERRKLRREVRVAKTSLGDIEVKLGWLNGKLVQIAPEFESCKKVAAERQVPLRDVYDIARRSFL